MTDTLGPGSTIGILGGGQLGRMLSVAASRLGLKTHIYEPGANPPAADVSHALTTAPYEDEVALLAFAEGVDVITYEFENIPARALEILAAKRDIRPGIKALEISQDRLTEKEFLQGLDLSTAPFAAVQSSDDLTGALQGIGTPSILKTRRFGYDGKGQARLKSVDDAPDALAAMSGAPAVLEGFVDFDYEVSVIAARSITGDIMAFEPGENLHRDGILRTTTLPSSLSQTQRKDALDIAETMLSALGYVGVIGVELFVSGSDLIVNEFAPRVHNSGHWTQDGAVVDQFEQHIRAVAGWPLGDTTRVCDITMENLIGNDIDRVAELARTAGATLHLYGKGEARPGRKMGHVNHVGSGKI